MGQVPSERLLAGEERRALEEKKKVSLALGPVSIPGAYHLVRYWYLAGVSPCIMSTTMDLLGVPRAKPMRPPPRSLLPTRIVYQRLGALFSTHTPDTFTHSQLACSEHSRSLSQPTHPVAHSPSTRSAAHLATCMQVQSHTHLGQSPSTRLILVVAIPTVTSLVPCTAGCS
jgi:hypothetical protein